MQDPPKLPAEEQPPEKRQKVQSLKRGGGAAPPLEAEAGEEEHLPLVEVMRRLRALEQPITLFGEVRASAAPPTCQRACA